MSKKYIGFSPEEIQREFDIADSVLVPTEDQLFYSAYEDENYEGNALVIYERNGYVFEVQGAHCSCYGLEGQWDPEETSWETLYKQLSRSDYAYYKWRETLLPLVEGRLRELSAKKELKGTDRFARTVRDLLRAAPMPYHESALGADEWYEAYSEWWRRYASENAILEILGEEDA